MHHEDLLLDKEKSQLDPTLGQLRNEKAELESILLKAVRNFTSKTGLKVTFIDVGLQEGEDGSVWYEFTKVEAAII